MIHISRGNAAPPQSFKGESARHMKAVEEFFGTTRHTQRRQVRFEFPLLSLPTFRDTLSALRTSFHDKCAYCETPFESRDGFDRFRPSAGAIGADLAYAPDHYWWLAYDWDNLYLACDACNKAKGAKFPVLGDRAPLRARTTRLARERLLLVDPCSDDPSLDLDFRETGEVVPLTRRGDATISTLALNRRALVDRRRRALQRVHATLADLANLDSMPPLGKTFDALVLIERLESANPSRRKRIKTLFPLVAATAPFAGAARALVARWYHDLVGDKQKHEMIRRVDKRLRTQYVTSIRLKKFRGLADLSLDIPATDAANVAPWCMLIGENGTGKSSILQAIALAVAGSSHWRGLGLWPQSLVRQGATKGMVEVTLSGASAPLRIDVRTKPRSISHKGDLPSRAVLAYGATRLLPRRGTAGPSRGTVRLHNLFNPFKPLLDADKWLAGLKAEDFDYVARALKDVLGLPRAGQLTRVRSRGRAAVKLMLNGAKLDLEQLSDGYQSVLGLTCDIIAGLMVHSKGAVESAEGIVLIDELGAHLHPRWKMQIVSSLRRAFPRVQFIVSTHDPLCLRGLSNGEVVVLRRTSRGRVYREPDLPPIKGLRVDQLLTSEYFGLNSTMDPDVEKRFTQLYRLLALTRPSDAQREQIATLRAELEQYDLPGTTRRERRLLQIIDKELARLGEEPMDQERLAIRKLADDEIAAELREALGQPAVLPS